MSTREGRGRSGQSPSVSELELYHDGELSADRAAEVAAMLGADPELRARYGSIARLDRVVTGALRSVDGVAEWPEAERRPRWGVLVGVPVAAAAAVGLGFVLAMLPWAGSSGPGAMGPLARGEKGGGAEAVVGAGVVGPELPGGEGGEGVSGPRGPRSSVIIGFAASQPGAASVVETGAGAGSAGAEGPIGPDPELIAAARRRAELVELGRSLRSAMLAEESFNSMSPEEQLEACRVWSSDPSLWPAVFSRLELLRGDPRVEAEFNELVAEWRGDRVLSNWLVSYRVVDGR